jgi:hypothetical protein
MTMKTEDGRLYVIGGASRSGKTAWTKKAIAKARRVLAWDPEAQWCELPGYKKITRRAEFMEAANKPGPLKLAYVAGGDMKEAFDFFAGVAFHAGRYVAPLDVIAEELADVTTPSKAPGNWGILLRRGLKRGITIWAISQRWSEADKTAVGNASDFVLFRQSSGDDVRYLARKTRVDESELNGLIPLQFVHMDALTGKINRGKLTF